MLAGSAGFGVLASQGLIALDGTSLRVVAPARGAISEQTAAAQDGTFSVEIEPEIGRASCRERVYDDV